MARFFSLAHWWAGLTITDLFSYSQCPHLQTLFSHSLTHSLTHWCGGQVAGTAQEATEVLCLMNMVTKEELEDDEEYEGKMRERNTVEPPIRDPPR